MDSRKAPAFRGILGFVLVCGSWMAVTLWNLSYDSVIAYLKTLTSLAVEDLLPSQHFHFLKAVCLSDLVLFWSLSGPYP